MLWKIDDDDEWSDFVSEFRADEAKKTRIYKSRSDTEQNRG